jgi:glucose-6-phosphate isomerase
LRTLSFHSWTAYPKKGTKMHSNGSMLSTSLGSYQERINSALQEMKDREVIKRIWEHDYTLWKPEPTEITNRLGWLHIADRMKSELPDLEEFVSEVRQAGFTQALLLGMGGSSLAPEVFCETFGVREGFLDLAVLDSTAPGAVADQAAQLDLAKTLFIVSTKSGGTVETLSFFKYFYNQAAAVDVDNPGSQFVAITDAGSRLHEIADEYKFRQTFLNDPNIGGRYSALSYFGLVPAALIGVDLEKLLERVDNMENHQAANLGAILGELARAGRDKLTLLTSPPISSFGNWVEQLIAESTGKEGTGIVPVVSEAINQGNFYGNDRLFVYIQLKGDATYERQMENLEASGHPVIRIQMNDLYDLGEQYFLWELATAVAGTRLKINPFNQPNVEAAKTLARAMVSTYQEQGELPALESGLDLEGITIYPDPFLDENNSESAQEVLGAFLAAAKPGAYIALQAYLQPAPDVDQALQALREQLRDKTRLATTLGYGPRFLHSTGQLHKGDAGLGMFIQLIGSPDQDIPIPDQPGSQESGISFGVLIQAQALGDRQALIDAGRRVITIDLGDKPTSGIGKLTPVV